MNRANSPDNPSPFHRWFGNSVVIDPQGQPKVVYHGSPDIRGIIANGFERSITRGEVYFFSDDYHVADTYTDGKRAWDYQSAEPHTQPFYLAMQNPYVIDAKGAKWRKTEQHIKEARDLGHDGIVIKNTRDEYHHTGNGGRLSTVYAVFNASQIASVEPTRHLYSRIDQISLGDLSILDRATVGLPPEAGSVDEAIHQENTAASLHDSLQCGAALEAAATEMAVLLKPYGLNTHWRDEGSRVFAEALNHWSKGKIKIGVTSREGHQGFHAVGVLALGDSPDAPCVLLDGSGVASAETLMHTLEQLDRDGAERGSVAFDGKAETWYESLATDESVAHRATTFLNLLVGSFQEWEASVRNEVFARAPQGLEVEHLDPVMPIKKPLNQPEM